MTPKVGSTPSSQGPRPVFLIPGPGVSQHTSQRAALSKSLLIFALNLLLLFNLSLCPQTCPCLGSELPGGCLPWSPPPHPEFGLFRPFCSAWETRSLVTRLSEGLEVGVRFLPVGRLGSGRKSWTRVGGARASRSFQPSASLSSLRGRREQAQSISTSACVVTASVSTDLIPLGPQQAPQLFMAPKPLLLGG